MVKHTSYRDGGAGSPASPTLSIKGAKERLLVNVMNVWKKKYPHEVMSFTKELDVIRHTKHKSNGMSLGGTQMVKAASPNRPWFMINKLLPDFWEKEGGVDLFLKTFTRFQIKDPK